MPQVTQQSTSPKLTIQQAARIMGVTPRFLQMGLQHERFPFGAAVKMDKRWSYYINTVRFWAYMEARDMKGASVAFTDSN